MQIEVTASSDTVFILFIYQYISENTIEKKFYLM